MHMVHKSTKTTPGTQQYVPGKIFEVLCGPETHLAVDKALSASKDPTAQDLTIVVLGNKLLTIASSGVRVVLLWWSSCGVQVGVGVGCSRGNITNACGGTFR